MNKLRKMLAVYFILVLTDILMSAWAINTYPIQLRERNESLPLSYLIMAVIFLLMWYLSSRIEGTMGKIIALGITFAIVLRIYVIVQNTIVILSVI